MQIQQNMFSWSPLYIGHTGKCPWS